MRKEIVETVKEINRGKLFSAVFQICAPCLQGRFGMSDHVFSDSCLRDIDSEFEQFAMNSRGSPEGIISLMVRMRLRTSLEIPGLPDLLCRHFQVQNKRNPLRCQVMTVSGSTMTSVERHSSQKRKSQIQRKRSQTRILGRLTERFKTMIWCRRARISVWSARRDRKPARRAENNEIRMLCMNQEAINPIP